MGRLTFRQRALRPAVALALTGAALLPLAAAQAQTTLAIDPKLPPSQSVALGIPKGQIDAAVAKLDDFAAALMKRSGVPGMAVVVVRDGKVIYLKGFGVRKVGETAPIDGDTVFQLASLSKSISASVVAHQVAAGVVGWDTPVSQHLPYFSLKDPWIGRHATIGDLFSHRSGLPDHAGDDLEDLGYDRRQVLERLKLLPLTAFRISYHYTNFGLTAAAEAVAVAAGKSWEDLADEVLYKPLGMASTSSRFADYMARADRAIPHVRGKDGFVALYQRDPDAQAPAGGVSSSARDMGHWLAFMLGNGTYEGREIVPAALLPAVAAQVVSTPAATASARPGFYGYGFDVSVAPSARMVVSHSGAFLLGAGTTFAMLPSEKLGIAVLTNAQPVGAAEALSMQFMDLVQFGSLTRDWFAAYNGLMAPLFKPEGSLVGETAPADSAPAQKLSAYAGTYANAYFGKAVVKVEKDHLTLALGPKPQVVALTHWSGDSFTYVPSGENAPTGSIAKVTFAHKGRHANGMTVDILNENGLGTFTRK